MTCLANLKIKVITILILILAGSSILHAAKIDSKWQDEPVVIDGMQMDWQGKLYNFDDKKVNFGVMNDNEYLYLLIAPTDEKLNRQAIAGGMIIWIDSKNSDKFGIRYPLGIPVDEIEFGRGPDGDKDRNREQHLETSLREIQLIDKDKKPIETIDLVNLIGINAKVEIRNERLVYELQFPLRSSADYPYGVEAKDGEEVKITIETVELDRSTLRKKMKEARNSGGEGGMGMPPGGGRGGGRSGMRGGGMRGGQRPEMPEPLKLKIKVKLAENKIEKSE